MAGLIDLRDIFFVEADELLSALEEGLRAIQTGAHDTDTVNAVFRAVHSIKGGAGAFDLKALVGFAHRFETVLDALRAGKLQPEPALLGGLLHASDHLADMISAARQGNATDPEHDERVIAALEQHAGGGGSKEEEAFVFEPLALDGPFGIDAVRLPLPSGTRDVTLKVVPPVAGATLGSGCYIDVESYINGELIGGIRKVDLPPVHPPVGEPPYAEREMWFVPDPPVVGQPAQICAELHNYAAVDQTVNAVLYVADFGMGLPFQQAGQLTNWVIPANSTSRRCLPWTPTPGGIHRCLQIRIQQQGYQDIISQRNIDLQTPPVGVSGSTEFTVGNPTTQTATVEMNITAVGIPEGWGVSTAWSEAELEPGETVTNTLYVTTTQTAPMGLVEGGHRASSGAAMALLGDEQFVAVEAFIGQDLIGGIQLDFAPTEQYIYLPLILKKVTNK